MLPPGVQTLRGVVPTEREVLVVPGAEGRFTERDGTTYVLASDGSVTVTPQRAVTVRKLE
jgi:hypothetical protein